MSFLNNYWKETSRSVKKISLVLRGLVTALTTNAYVQGNVKMAFYVLLAGAALDMLLQFLPPDDPSAPGGNISTLTGTAAAILALITFLASGCSTIKPIASTVKTDSVYTTYKQVDIKLSGAKVLKAVDVDSLLHASLQARTQQTADMNYKQDSTAAAKAHETLPAKPINIITQPIVHYFTDPETKAQLSYWIDEYGKLQLGCESKDQVVHSLQAQVNKLSSQVTTQQVIVQKTPAWNWVAICTEGVLLLICIVILIIKTIL